MSLGALEDLGVDLLREGEVEAALLCLREAMERGTRDPEVRKAYVHGMVTVFSKMEAENASAQAAGEDAILDTRETHEALLMLSEDNARDQPDPDNHLLHGMCLMLLGRYAEAIEAYERGLAIDPTDSGLQQARRQVQAVLGR